MIASNENDLFIRLGIDNIEGIYQNFLELIHNDYGLKKLMRKIDRSEISLDIPREDSVISCIEEV